MVSQMFFFYCEISSWLAPLVHHEKQKGFTLELVAVRDFKTWSAVWEIFKEWF